MVVETWMWVVGAVVVPLGTAATAWWWRVESEQNRNLEQLRDCNGRDHKELRKELADIKATGHKQHVEVLDKVTEVWQHLVKNNRK